MWILIGSQADSVCKSHYQLFRGPSGIVLLTRPSQGHNRSAIFADFPPLVFTKLSFWVPFQDSFVCGYRAGHSCHSCTKCHVLWKFIKQFGWLALPHVVCMFLELWCSALGRKGCWSPHWHSFLFFHFHPWWGKWALSLTQAKLWLCHWT